MIGKKINQLATELAPVSTDLTIIGDPTTGVSKKITLAQLGAIFSGAVSFYTNLAGFPATGDINVIYCAKDTQKLYLWSGSAYVEVFPSQALLDTYQLRSEKGVSNGYASLDSSGKVPISQLPSSIMEYKGTWNAATNTPTLANGTGDTGDVYICNVAGTVNFGAGPITFAVGDYTIYSGSIWQRSSGAVGTVTSVAASITGNAIGITGSPVTTSGTLAFAFAGTGAQYIKGDGTLATFPSTIAQAERLITEVYNSTGATLTKGTIVYINGGQGNLPTVTKALATGDSTSAQTFGVVQADITNNNNGYVVVAGKLSDLDTQAYTEGTQLYLSSTTAGTWTSTKQYAPAHLVYVGIVVRSHPTQGIVEVKIMNGFEIDELHNVAAQTPSNNDGLFWESSTSLWKNKSISTILGGTPITGSGNVNAIPKFTANSVLGNSVMEDDGNFVSMRGLKLNVVAGSGSSINFGQASSISAAGLGYSSIGASGTAGFIFYIDQNTTQRSFIIDVNNINSATTRNYSMPNSSGTFALTSDIPSLTGYVPYTGATNNVNLGTYDLLSRSVYIEGTASYQAGLLMKQINGFNFVTGAYTQVVPSGIYDLYVVHNQTNGTRRRYAISVASLQDGDDFQYLVPRKSGTFAMTSDIPSLTGYVQGTGTTNYLPKFTGTSTIGNSAVFESGGNVGIGTATPSQLLHLETTLGSSSGVGTAIQITSGGAGGDQAWIGVNKGTGNGFEISVENRDIIFNTGAITPFGGTERMRLTTSGNLGLGVTPSAWSSTLRVLEIGGPENGYIAFNPTNLQSYIYWNAYYDTDNRYKKSSQNAAAFGVTSSGSYAWYQAPSGTAGNAISFTQAMTLDANGRLGIGITSPSVKLDVYDASNSVAYVRTGSQILKLSASTTKVDIDNIAGDPMSLSIGGTPRLTIASTGAATFSSSVTAGTNFISVPNTNSISVGTSEAENAKYNYLGHSGYWGIKTTTTGFSFALDTYNGGTPKNVLTITQAGAATFSSNMVSINGNGLTEFKINNNTSEWELYMPSGGTDLRLYRGSDKVTFLANGNVGIGTTNPSSILHTSSSNGTVRFASSTGNDAGRIVLMEVGLDAWSIDGDKANGQFTIRDEYNSSTRFVIGNTGNVGIGTTSPTSNLSVRNEGTSGISIIDVRGGVSGAGVVQISGNGTTLGSTSFDLIQNSAGALILQRDNNPLSFYTNNTERMRISSGGLIYMNNLGGYSGSFSDVRYDTSSKELFYQTSSRRYKDNIVNLENTLSKVNQLRAVRFIDKHTQRENCGFIAEEVIEIIPDVVFKKEIDGKLEVEGINYSDFAPFIIKALQEQQAEIEALKLELKNK